MDALADGNHAVVLEAKYSQKFRQQLESLGYWDYRRRLKKLENGQVAIPILQSAVPEILQNPTLDTFQYSLRQLDLPPSKKMTICTPYDKLVSNTKIFIEKAGGQLIETLVDDLPKHWEIHGDLALLPENCYNCEIWQQMGIKYWQVVAECLSVKRLAKKSVISTDQFRSPQVMLLLGDNGWVQHMDNGVKYSYDVTRCMFSAGNITEKLRVAGMDCEGQTVVDLFAGIGYFTLPYLVHARAALVHACEWNPHAVAALRKNLQDNGVADRCHVYHGDNRQVSPVGVADRVNLGLIPSSEMSWPTACAALKPDRGGILHIHANVTTRADSITRNDRDKISSAGGMSADGISQEGIHINKETKVDSSTRSIKDTCKTLSPTKETASENIHTNFSSKDDNNSSIYRDDDKPLTADVDEKAREGKETERILKYGDVTDDSSSGDTESEREFRGSSKGDRTYQYLDSPSCTTASNLVYGVRPLAPISTEESQSSTKESDKEGQNDCSGMDQNLGERNGGATSLISLSTGEDGRLQSVKEQWEVWAKCTAQEIQSIIHKVHPGSWTARVVHIEHVKSYAPHVDHLVLDLDCRPTS